MRKAVFCIALVVAATSATADQFGNGHPVRWKENGGIIDNSSVCYNHKRGSIAYRRCRSEAAKLFKQKCRSVKSEKFCKASRTFRPVDAF